MTKSDFAVVKIDMENRMTQFEEKIENRLTQFEEKIDGRFAQSQLQMQIQMRDLEFRLTTRLGVMMVSVTSIAVAALTWLIKF